MEEFQPKNLDEAITYILDNIAAEPDSIEILKQYSKDEDGFISS